MCGSILNIPDSERRRLN